ncbi:MAG: aminotransferase class [Mycobacterium sp.]|nr:aminotransferase class [Mycobacterium sp.]
MAAASRTDPGTRPGGAPGWLDHAAATPLHPAAREALLACLDDGWADPERRDPRSRHARALLDGAREAVAGTLGVGFAEVSFAGSATQATQLALLGTLRARHREGRRLVASAVEHSAVLHVGQRLVADGGDTVVVPVDGDGVVAPDAFLAACTPGTVAAALQAANGEVGSRQPLAAVGPALAERGVALHVDAAALLPGELPDVAAWQPSTLTLDAAGWGGPAGVGVLVVRPGTRWQAPLPPDGREGGRVPGRSFLPAVVAAAAALLVTAPGQAALARRHAELTGRLRAELPRLVPDLVLHGPADPAARVPSLLSFSLLYVDAEALLLRLAARGVVVGSGSACVADSLEPSHVLSAMGTLTGGNLRLSLGWPSTAADVERLLAELPGAVAELRDEAGVTGL